MCIVRERCTYPVDFGMLNAGASGCGSSARLCGDGAEPAQNYQVYGVNKLSKTPGEADNCRARPRVCPALRRRGAVGAAARGAGRGCGPRARGARRGAGRLLGRCAAAAGGGGVGRGPRRAADAAAAVHGDRRAGLDAGARPRGAPAAEAPGVRGLCTAAGDQGSER